MPRDSEYAVIEIGMNHPGEIAPLSRQARPHVALITTVAAVHLEAFEDVAEIAREKAAVLQGLEPGGVAVLNGDIAEAGVLRDAAAELGVETLWFGSGAAECRLSSVFIEGEETLAHASVLGHEVELHIQSLGAHFAMNALGALACVSALGADLDRAVTRLALWSPVKGRGAREQIKVGTGEILLLDDSYNANPTSMMAALEVLAATPGQGRRIAYLGDMKELGPQEVADHIALAKLPALTSIDKTHCIGPLMKHLHAALPADRRGNWYSTSAEVLADLGDQIQTGDIVLAKGSLSVALGKIVDGIRNMGHAGPDSDITK